MKLGENVNNEELLAEIREVKSLILEVKESNTKLNQIVCGNGVKGIAQLCFDHDSKLNQIDLEILKANNREIDQFRGAIRLGIFILGVLGISNVFLIFKMFIMK